MKEGSKLLLVLHLVLVLVLLVVGHLERGC